MDFKCYIKVKDYEFIKWVLWDRIKLNYIKSEELAYLIEKRIRYIDIELLTDKDKELFKHLNIDYLLMN